MSRTIFTSKCKICNHPISLSSRLSLARRNTSHFCSKQCLYHSKEWRNSIFRVGHKRGVLQSNPNWNGGRNIDEKGYVRITYSSKKWIYEHRLVMQTYLGRKLTNKEHIHHKDGNKTNNKIDNLQLFPDARSHALFHNSVV